MCLFKNKKSQLFSVFKYIMALIYVATWRNEERSIKSQTFRLGVVYISIYKIGRNIYAKKCLLKCYNPSN